MGKLSEKELKALIRGGETNSVELKLAAPRAVDLAERFCGMANSRGEVVIIGVEDSSLNVVGCLMNGLGRPWMSSYEPPGR